MSDARNDAFDPSQVELLFVDDDDDFRNTAARRFARRGFHVQEAPGVNDALRQLQDRQFDVVVSDMAMPGLFELADGGTLFIDEIGEMPGVMQAKLLRVLQDGSMRRVGSLQERRVNVRIITATNRDLAKEVAEHRFREDLYYRINVMSFDLPPLRARSGDIPLLVNHFLGSGWQIAPDALCALETYQWPGNIRQLINVIERAKILAEDQLITTDELPAVLLQPTTTAGSAVSAPTIPTALADDGTLSAIEKARVVEVMQKQKGNKSRAAQVLGISRRSLYRLLEKYNLDGSSTPAEQPST